MAATIRDIKEQTGLSLATISKYLNGGNVLPENKVKIEAAIKDLHYSVNEIARGLVTSKTRTVGVIVYSIESLFNGTLLHHIGNALRAAGYGLLICDSMGDVETEAQNIKFLVNKKVDGIIVVPVSTNAEFLEPARKAEIPTVLLDRAIFDGDYDCVRIDNRITARKAVDYLIRKGHKKIAIISSGEEYTGLERYKGYKDALKEAGIEVVDEYVQNKGTHSIEYGTEGMANLLELKDAPTAVFCTNYEITLGAVMMLNDSKKSCPEDISILGFDDLILSHIVKPNLSIVVQPMKEMSEKAVEVLLGHIDGNDGAAPVEVVVGAKLVEGDSVKDLNKKN